jgi:hypothetical protein
MQWANPCLEQAARPDRNEPVLRGQRLPFLIEGHDVSIPRLRHDRSGRREG